MLKRTYLIPKILTVNIPFIWAVPMGLQVREMNLDQWALFPSQQSVQICWTPTDVNKNVEQNYWYLLLTFQRRSSITFRGKRLKLSSFTKQRMSKIIETGLFSSIESLTFLPRNWVKKTVLDLIQSRFLKPLNTPVTLCSIVMRQEKNSMHLKEYSRFSKAKSQHDNKKVTMTHNRSKRGQFWMF